jgi:hypothetical protein
MIQKMKSTVIIILIFALTIHASGQVNFVTGTVVTLNGDSLTGKIDYREWKKMPEKIIFENTSGQRQSYDAASLSSFIVIPKNETYISRSVEIDMTPDDPDKVLRENITSPYIAEKTIFILQLVKHATVSLYQFTDDYNKIHFFYVKENEKPVELIHHYIYSEQSLQTEHNTKFKEQLAILFAACPTVVAKTENLKYREKELQQLVVKYLNCITPASAIEIKKKAKLPIIFGVMGGAMFNSYKFKGVNNLAQDNYSSSQSPLVGASVDIGLSRSYDKFHIITELVYKKYKTSNSFTRNITAGYTSQNDVAFSLSYIQLNTLIRHIFSLTPVVKPYINIGVGNAFMITEKENKIYTKYSYGNEETGKAIDGPKKYEFSSMAGIGVGIKKIQFELRYGYSKKAFSPYSNLNITANSSQFILTYRF